MGLKTYVATVWVALSVALFAGAGQSATVLPGAPLDFVVDETSNLTSRDRLFIEVTGFSRAELDALSAASGGSLDRSAWVFLGTSLGEADLGEALVQVRLRRSTRTVEVLRGFLEDALPEALFVRVSLETGSELALNGVFVGRNRNDNAGIVTTPGAAQSFADGDLVPVPLPASMPLLLVGLAGLWILRRRNA